MKKFVALIIIALIFSTTSVYAHSGRTDANGGHNCRVGACAGTYHYHNGGSAPPAPRTPVSPSPAPRAPVTAKKIHTENVAVKFSEKTEYTSKEYSGHFKVLREGADGVNKMSTEITYINGRETSRAAPVATVITAPTDKVVEQGVRISPEARITSISKTNKKDKYDVSGEYKAKSEVVLSVNGKKVKRAKTDHEGKFTFRGIKIKGDKAELIIYKREKRKENQVSEKTFANLVNLTLETEYERLRQNR